MGPKPSRWASDAQALPPSLTPDHQLPQPLRDISADVGVKTSSTPLIAGLAKLFDNDSASEVVLPGAAFTLEWQFARPHRVGLLTLTSGANAAAPSAWQLQASLDGLHWITLQSNTDEPFAWPRQTRAFAVARAGDYRHYRLRFDAARGIASRALAQIELLGDASP